MIILHVDDVMIATDGSPQMEKLVASIHDKYPFGEWVKVCEVSDITYTGRRIKFVAPDEISIEQSEFIQGRLALLPHTRGKPDEGLCDVREIALFRSAVGNLHWVTSQSRPDLAVYTSRLQKVQNRPTYKEFRELAKTLKYAKSTADQALRIKA